MTVRTKGHLSFAFKVLIRLIAVLGVLALIFFILSIVFRPAEYYAKKHWSDICEKIDNGEVISAGVYLWSGSPVDIDVESCLSAEDFKDCGSEYGDPGTPDYVIKIVFSDETQVSFENFYESNVFYFSNNKEKYYFTSEELFSRVQALLSE